ncbi:GNAT family N-acetyltransferase [Enemella dayhoffiae]|uniref:GNAT family N-acetyltransferase n=1 Tax=Enemella dayhoffiae TaxID=2016507 RepID=UPI001594F9AC|nr:GNAT family N-acetyltransferase [Enemella dayhoffiae]
METVKTRDAAAAEEAAQIWAHATAKRDENPASDVNHDEAVNLVQESLAHSDRSFLLCLNTDEGMMAFAAIEPSRGSGEEVGEIRYLGVAPGHWGEGWARRLLVAVPGAMRENDFSSGELWVYADNIRAIFVYEAMGWIGTEQTRRHPVTDRVEQRFVLKLG